MKIIKLDRRHKFYRENDMRYAVAFNTKDGWPNSHPYEHWLTERLGHHNWGISSEWMSGWPTMYGSRNYYVAVKDPSILTLMALAVGVVDEN
jgi:hypothetical protein